MGILISPTLLGEYWYPHLTEGETESNRLGNLQEYEQTPQWQRLSHLTHCVITQYQGQYEGYKTINFTCQGHSNYTIKDTDFKKHGGEGGGGFNPST